MTWKSLGPVREGSQQSSTSAPFNLSASSSASKISGATRFRDMYTFAPLNGFGFIIFPSKLNFIYLLLPFFKDIEEDWERCELF